MKIDSKFVNASIKDYSYKVHWRKIMNYAAAVNDDNPYYFNDEKEEGIVAPPMYIVAITWPIIENLKNFIQIEKFPIKVLKTIVHYTEHIKIHRLIKPNDELFLKGKIVAILPHRAGTHIVIRLDANDKNNNPVFTEHIGGMLRGVKLDGDGLGENTLPYIPVFSNATKPLWKKTIEIDKLRSFIYDGCTDIIFAIHTSKKFAHFVGLPGIILQGTATLAYTVKEIINTEAGGNPHKIKEIYCKFTGMVKPGTIIQLQLNNKSRLKENTELYFDVYNDENKKAISNGFIVLNNF